MFYRIVLIVHEVKIIDRKKVFYKTNLSHAVKWRHTVAEKSFSFYQISSTSRSLTLNSLLVFISGHRCSDKSRVEQNLQPRSH